MVYQVPSAPPHYLDNDDYPQANNRAQNNYRKNLNLTDECAICYDQLKVRPLNDNNVDLVVAKTACNHFFHECCLDDWLKKSAHKDCPECRRDVYKSQVTLIPVDMQPVMPNQNNRNPVAPAQEGPSTAARIAQGAANIGKSVLVGAYNLIFTDSPETIKNRQIEIEHRIAEIHLKWNKMPKFFQIEKEEIDVALASVRSLMANHSKEALKAVKKLESHITMYETSIKTVQKELVDELKYFQQDLAKIVSLNP